MSNLSGAMDWLAELYEQDQIDEANEKLNHIYNEGNHEQ